MYYRPEYCDDGDACRVICIVRPIAVCAALNSDSMENTSFKPEPCIFASIFYHLGLISFQPIFLDGFIPVCCVAAQLI